jgi:hypothetical protein
MAERRADIAEEEEEEVQQRIIGGSHETVADNN